jgi:hypothetical protein
MTANTVRDKKMTALDDDLEAGSVCAHHTAIDRVPRVGAGKISLDGEDVLGVPASR